VRLAFFRLIASAFGQGIDGFVVGPWLYSHDAQVQWLRVFRRTAMLSQYAFPPALAFSRKAPRQIDSA
jgi:hypothetical protein